MGNIFLVLLFGVLSGVIIGLLIIIIYRMIHLVMQKRTSHGYIQGYKMDLEADKRYLKTDREEHAIKDYKS